MLDENLKIAEPPLSLAAPRRELQENVNGRNSKAELQPKLHVAGPLRAVNLAEV
jgi:hypothetical protein